MTIRLSQLLVQARAEAGALTLDVPAGWMQGRSVFGGLQVALALKAMRALVPAGTLRTVQTTFVAPVAGLIRVRAQILRTGKNATHVEARIVDGDATLALVVAVFGNARRSQVSRTLVPREVAFDEAEVIEIPFGGGGYPVPEFTKHFNVRWLQGKPPFSGDPGNQQVLEMALDDEGPTTEAHLAAIADYIAPVGLSQLSSPAPGSSLTWMLELLVDRVDQFSLRGWRVEAELLAAHDGYTSQSVAVFGPNGVAIALSRQTMLVFG